MFKVAAVCLVGLTSYLEELDLFTTVPADADRAGEILPQKLLLPLQN